MQDDPERLAFTRRLALAERERLAPSRWRPAADIYRGRSGWLIKVELAGVEPDQVEVRTRGRYLYLAGTRRDVTRLDGYACHAMEIAYSEFRRVFELPVDLHHADVELQCQEGMLLIRVQLHRETP